MILKDSESDYDYEDSMMMMVVMSALPFTWSPDRDWLQGGRG